MKRLRSILFNTLTAISLLLALATAGLWVRSGFVADEYFREQVWKDAGIRVVERQRLLSYKGGFHFISINGGRARYRDHEYSQWWTRTTQTLDPYADEAVGLERFTPEVPAFGHVKDSRGSEFAIAMWIPLFLCFGLPGFRLMGWLRSRGSGVTGRCPACGYDMRANPARCSECGAPASTNVQIANAE